MADGPQTFEDALSRTARCPHCGMDINPDWGPCAHDPATPRSVVEQRLRGR